MNHQFKYPEGATPIDDISGLKLSWIHTQSHLNRAEAENISSAVDKYLRFFRGNGSKVHLLDLKRI